MPPMMQGIFDDFWQRPLICKSNGKTFLGDVGLAGPDGGKGGKFLLLPPDYAGEIHPTSKIQKGIILPEIINMYFIYQQIYQQKYSGLFKFLYGKKHHHQ